VHITKFSEDTTVQKRPYQICLYEICSQANTFYLVYRKIKFLNTVTCLEFNLGHKLVFFKVRSMVDN
jgi:hypothetical protein